MLVAACGNRVRVSGGDFGFGFRARFDRNVLDNVTEACGVIQRIDRFAAEHRVIHNGSKTPRRADLDEREKFRAGLDVSERNVGVLDLSVIPHKVRAVVALLIVVPCSFGHIHNVTAGKTYSVTAVFRASKSSHAEVVRGNVVDSKVDNRRIFANAVEIDMLVRRTVNDVYRAVGLVIGVIVARIRSIRRFADSCETADDSVCRRADIEGGFAHAVRGEFNRPHRTVCVMRSGKARVFEGDIPDIVAVVCRDGIFEFRADSVLFPARFFDRHFVEVRSDRSG